MYLLLFIWSLQTLFAQSNGQIEGTVYTSDELVLPYATVRIDDLTTKSGEDGSFHLDDISPGRHLLVVSAVGYESFSDTITKHASENLRLEIRLISSDQTLSEVEILGKTETQRVKEQPIRTLVIDTRAVSTQATSLTDLMNRNTGIRIRQNGGLGSRPEISINGFQGRAIKYFKDGIPLDYLGDGYNIASLPLEALERVEVYKGVLPVSLGADALGGAVNLVTRQHNGTQLNTFYEIGSFNSHRAGAMGSTESKNKQWFFGTELFFNYADNDYRANVDVINPETRNPETRRLPLFHNAFRSYYGEAFVGLQNQSWADELRLSLAVFDLMREQQHPALMTDAYGAVQSKQNSIIPTLRYKKVFMDDRLSVDQFVSYNDLQTQRIDTLHGSYDWYGNFTPRATRGETRLPSLSDIHEEQSVARTSITYKFSPFSRVGFNYVFTNATRYGSDPYGPRISETDIDVLSLRSKYQKHVLGASLDNFWLDGKLHNQAMGKLYLYNATGLQNSWFSTGVTLLDEHSQSGKYWGLADAIKYQLSPSSLLRASAEFSYRLPERDELFGNNVFIVPNFELSPERSLNVNLGYQYNYQNTFIAEVNTFFRRTEDMILLVPIQAPNAQFQNQENVKGYGFDVDLSYRFLEHYRISANASWQNLRLFGISSLQNNWKNDARLRNTPYFFANAALNSNYADVLSANDELKFFLNYNFLREFYLETIPKDLEPGGFLGLSGSAKLNSNLLIPNQHLLNFGFTYRLPSEHISIGAEVRNLLDTELFDYYRIPRPGRGFNIKLSYQL